LAAKLRITLQIHNWFDESKSFFTDFRHRALRHHAEGIFLCERIFGVAIVNNEGNQVPVRYVGEQHVREDLGRIPTAQDWLSQIKPARWMYGQRFRAGRFRTSSLTEFNSQTTNPQHAAEYVPVRRP
jgi:hypothetical protein